MLLKEMMRGRETVYQLPMQARIFDAASLMREEQIGFLVVTDDSRRVEGVITDRDIALSLSLGAATPHSLLSEIMTKPVQTVDESQTLFDLSRQFRISKVKRLPVVDSHGDLKGVISLDDVMALLSREMFDTCKGLESKIGHLV